MLRKNFFTLTTILGLLLAPFSGLGQNCLNCPGGGNDNVELSPAGTHGFSGTYLTLGGIFSNSSGNNNFAYGGQSGGPATEVISSDYSFAFGEEARVENINAGGFAFGNSTEVLTNSDYSLAFGEEVSVDGQSLHAFAFGNNTEVIQESPASFAFGLETRILENSPFSFAFGERVRILEEGEYDFAFGRDIEVGRPDQFVAGWDGEINLRANPDRVTANPTFTTTGNGAPPTIRTENNRSIGFSTNNPAAPYIFEETGFSPLGNGQGEANIIQNYAAFPNFKDVGPNPNGNEAKWIGIGERPPGAQSTQVAYGYNNVWQNNQGGFLLLDQNPSNTSQSQEKDVAITFQDVWNQNTNQVLTNPENAGNRLKFIFRTGQNIENPAGRNEIMRMEPTGEVLVNNTSEDAILDVNGKTTNKNDFSFYAANTNGAPALVARNNQKVFVSTDNPPSASNGEELQVQGGIFGTSLFITSDMRMKKDTQLIQNPLEKLAKLNGYTYKYENNKYTKGFNFDNKRRAGVIAQQLNEVLPEAVQKGQNGVYSVNYDAIIPLLIEAHKQQRKALEAQKNKNKNLKEKVKKQSEQIQKMQERLNSLAEKVNTPSQRSFKNSDDETTDRKTVEIEGDNKKQAMLLQNRPNPYSNKTVIPYYLPENFQEANILITNIQGNIVKRINLDKPGKGELILRTEGLDAGQYQYSLIVDGRKIETRKMIISRK